MKQLVIFILVFSTIIFTQCNSKIDYSEKHELKNESWAFDDIQKFNFAISDTSLTYNILLKLTNTDDYPMANLYMFTNTILPDKTYFRDTIEFILSNPKGEWTGSGMFAHTNTFNFRNGIKFPQTGEYSFTFEQAMRCRNEACSMEGVKSIEFILEKN